MEVSCCVLLTRVGYEYRVQVIDFGLPQRGKTTPNIPVKELTSCPLVQHEDEDDDDKDPLCLYSDDQGRGS